MKERKLIVVVAALVAAGSSAAQTQDAGTPTKDKLEGVYART